MASNELPTRVAELMLRQGVVVAFGPDYLENSLLMAEQLGGALAGKAFLSAERIDDLGLPNGPALNGLLIFFHRIPSHMTWGSWRDALLKGVALPEDPKVEFVPVGRDEMQLILTWSRPLESSHIAATARAIERAYAENGGQYAKPGLLKRLKDLLP